MAYLPDLANARSLVQILPTGNSNQLTWTLLDPLLAQKLDQTILITN